MKYEHVEDYLPQFPKTFVALLLKFMWDFFFFFFRSPHQKSNDERTWWLFTKMEVEFLKEDIFILIGENKDND